ncbi:exodeoxyribonuclease V subunit gamma [Lysobacter sp. LF1]|uniref:RecBCD enzyme subunit RecC n=1 Tax=Lysobacter stagni TaxID=3045172 RepID=A0ABT6XDC2_9GAMM|nr:exodeoxyribonuclease V subunit gamma [Lysobacter sp. LF1]MDI9238123.1 exodeoxyribonuclease V subunit gamma [Lysobacter sp. LF1]
MPGRSDFRLYHSNALDVLAELLARQLREPVPGRALLVPDVVLIPQVAMRRWLQSTLAQRHGVAANLRFLTPGEFVRDVLDANVPGASEDLDAAALQWRLYAQLSDRAALSGRAFAPLREYLGGDDALKPWALSGELASIFEKYQAWRRDWLLEWEAGREPQDPQAELWRRVASGSRHRARRIDDYLARFGADNAPLPASMPARMFAFGTLNISPDVLRVIATQARVGTLHFHVPTPSRRYWGDLPSYAQRLREDPAEHDDENPLLANWGGAGRDFMAVLGGYEVVHPSQEIERYADPEALPDDAPERDSLLGRMQRDLLHRRGPRPWRRALDRDDPSLQVHACHTRLREVQVLHDRLRALLDDDRFDPPLQARDIAVLAPDIDPYRPHIEAVFGGAGGTRDYIPYALADLSPLAGEPLAEVFLRLLALPDSRFGVSEVLDLLATPALSQAAGLDAAGLERLREWLHESGARWGLDPDHRQRHDAPADDAYTWRFALDRLLLGHASGDDGDIAGVAPWTELEGSALDALDALVRVLRVLARHERLLGRAMPPAQWRDVLFSLLEALLPEHPREAADQRAIDRLRRHVDAFALSAQDAGFDRPVPPDVARAYFQQALSETDTRAPLLTGGVSFARMVPMRLIPFRVICVLGMNDGDYPRRDPVGGLNRMAMELTTPQRRHGDRSLREDDRFLFLQLFASAGEVFYASWLGADPRDGSAREPSVLVSELLDVAGHYHHAVDARDALVLHHPLQPFSPRTFGIRDEPRHFSYQATWHPAADALAAPRIDPAPWFSDVLPAEPSPTELPLIALRRFLVDPAGQFLRQRMRMRLPDEIESLDDLDPLAPSDSGLERWKLDQAVFDACAEGDVDDLAAHLRARAMLPSGPLGERQLAAVRARLQPFAAALREWRQGDAHTRAFELDIDGVRLYGHLDRLYPHGALRVRLNPLHGPAQVAHGLDWLVLSALGDARPLAQLAQWDGRPEVRSRPAIGTVQARAALRDLLALYRDGLRAPLPFHARSGWVWYEAPRGDEVADQAAWKAARGKWQGDFQQKVRGDADNPGIQLALRGRDPFAGEFDDADGARFRDIAARLFDALVHGRTEAAA